MRSAVFLVSLAGIVAANKADDHHNRHPKPTPAPIGPSCHITNTFTQLQGKDHGCAYNPNLEPCIYD
ncbi:hypothetical protein E4U55_005255, partial [Claviceps digitariae]